MPREGTGIPVSLCHNPHESLTGSAEGWWPSPSGLRWHCSPDFPLRSCYLTRDHCSPSSLHLHGCLRSKPQKNYRMAAKEKHSARSGMWEGPAQEAPRGHHHATCPGCSSPKGALRCTCFRELSRPGSLHVGEESEQLSLSLSLHHRRLPKFRVSSSLFLSTT